MRGLCRPSMAVGLVLLAICTGNSSAGAQDRLKVEIVPRIPHSNEVISATLSPDGTRVLTGSRDKTLKLWDVGTGRLIRTFASHSETVSLVAFSADAARLVSADWDRTVKLWGAANGQLLRTFKEASEGEINALALSPDGRSVLPAVSAGSSCGTPTPAGLSTRSRR